MENKKIPDSLKNWLKGSNEFIKDIHSVQKYNAIHFNTGKHEYIYYPDTDKLFVEIKREITEYEPVLYPNRAVETQFEGM